MRKVCAGREVLDVAEHYFDYANLGFRLSSTHAKAKLSNSVSPASGTHSGTNNAGAFSHGKRGKPAQMRQMLLFNLEETK